MRAAYGAPVEVPKPFLVATGGVAGATARWAVLEGTSGAAWSLLAINTLGAFLLGLLVAAGADTGRRLLLGVGFCGAFTTFSTFAVDIARDLDRGAYAAPAALVLIGFGTGVGAVRLAAITAGRSGHP